MDLPIGIEGNVGFCKLPAKSHNLPLGEWTAFAVTSAFDGLAVAHDVKGSRRMGSVTDLSNVYRGTLQGCYPPVNRAWT
jgi:hypothetical protein